MHSCSISCSYDACLEGALRYSAGGLTTLRLVCWQGARAWCFQSLGQNLEQRIALERVAAGCAAGGSVQMVLRMKLDCSWTTGCRAKVRALPWYADLGKTQSASVHLLKEVAEVPSARAAKGQGQLDHALAASRRAP